MGSLKAALTEKCPRCEATKLFKYKQYLPVSSKAFEMHKYCSNCGLKYEREIGFFYGAMYVSYGLNMALFLTCLTVFWVFLEGKYSWWYFGVGFVAITFLMVAVIYRLSRSIWLALFTKYDPEARDEKNLGLNE